MKLNIEKVTIGDCVLYCGDCMDVLPTLGKVDSVVTDPPYDNDEKGVILSHPGVGEVRNATPSMTNPWGYSLDWIECCPDVSHWVVFANYRMLGDLGAALGLRAKVSCVFAWQKPNAPNPSRPVPRMDCEFIIWSRSTTATCARMGEFRSQVIIAPNLSTGCFASPERVLIDGTTQAAHRCQKPLSVVQPFVDRLDCDTILDPFMGSGTTGVACVQLGRKFIGIEKHRPYFDIACRRIREAYDQRALFEPPPVEKRETLDLFAEAQP